MPAKPLVAASILIGAFLSLGQVASALHEASVSDIQRRIRALNDKFLQMPAATQKELDAVTSQIHTQIDAFVLRTVDANAAGLNSEAVVKGLAEILPASDEEPAGFTGKSAAGRYLIAAYTLHKGSRMGSGATSVTVRAYNQTARGVRFVDVIGDNMDGYGEVTVKAIHSPLVGETWLLLSGYATGANGPNNRMRIYAYDGKKFRPIWMPENVWGRFDVRVTDNGFIVEGDYYRDSRKRRDAYVVSSDGVILASPQRVQ